jgi:hypothetical protein
MIQKPTEDNPLFLLSSCAISRSMEGGQGHWKEVGYEEVHCLRLTDTKGRVIVLINRFVDLRLSCVLVRW